MFSIKAGHFHAVNKLDAGTIPLISCGFLENGFVDYYDIPTRYQHSHALTIAFNGSWPLTTKYHPYTFGAKDDVAVLSPLRPLQERTLLYIGSLIDKQKWRYSYGRKCFKAKLQNVTVYLPVTSDGKIDEDNITRVISKDVIEYLPEQQKTPQVSTTEPRWKIWKINELFEISRGDFHSISDLDAGDGSIRLVSRVTTDNGTVGYFIPPDNAEIYEPQIITVSTLNGDAFVQMDNFIATDNVLILRPLNLLHLTTLYFIQSMINQQRWRYSYGRQCYKTKFSELKLYLPITKTGELDEELMAIVVRNTPYWPIIESAYSC
jgi:hypothetical protein